LQWYDLEKPKLPNFCTCNLSRRVWPGLPSYALTALAKKFGIVYNAHNALDDAYTCGKLVLMAGEKLGKTTSIEEMLTAAGVRMH